MQPRSVIASSSLAQGDPTLLPPRGAAAISPRRVVRGEQRGSQGVTQLEQLDASPPTSLPCCDGSEVSDVSISEVPSKLCSVTADDTSMSSFLDRCCLRHSLMHGSKRVNPASYRRRARATTRPRSEHRGGGLAATMRGASRPRHPSPVGRGRRLRNRGTGRNDTVSANKAQRALASSSPFNYSDTSFYSCASSASSVTASRRTASHESVASRTSKSVSHSAVSESVRSCSLTLTGIDTAARLGTSGRPARALPSLRSTSTQPCSSSTGKLGTTVEGLPCSVSSHDGGNSVSVLQVTRTGPTVTSRDTNVVDHSAGTPAAAASRAGGENRRASTRNTSTSSNNGTGDHDGGCGGGGDMNYNNDNMTCTSSGDGGDDHGRAVVASGPSDKAPNSAHGTASLHTPPALQVTQLCQRPHQSPLSGELSALYGTTAAAAHPTPPNSEARHGRNRSGSTERWRAATSTTPSHGDADSPSMTRALQRQQERPRQGGTGASLVVSRGELDRQVSQMPDTHDAVTTSETTTPTGDGGHGFDPANVEKLDRIGRGSYGNVYVGIDRRTNRKVAIKELLVECDFTMDLEKQLTTLEREIVVMRKVQHPNTIRYLGAARSGNCLLIYMEYVSGGTLGARIKANGPYSDAEARNFTRQLLLGLEYLHSRNIVHRDLKGDNLFLTEDGVLKLGDFGTSKELVTSLVTDSIAGTPNFMAPEVIDCSGHSYEADIWSVGCCVLEMLTGAPPFSGLDNQMAVLYAVMKRHFENEIPKTLSAGAQDFIKVCTRAEPKERWTATQLLSHPWLRGEELGEAAPPVPRALPAPVAESPHQKAHEPQPPSSSQRHGMDGGAVRGGGGARSPALDAAVLSCEAGDGAGTTAAQADPAGKQLSPPPSVGEALMPSPETNGATTSNDSSKLPTPVSRKKHGKRRHQRSRHATSRSVNGSDMSQSSPKGMAMNERPFTDQTLTPIGPSVHFGSHEPVPPFTRSSAAFTRESGGSIGVVMPGGGGGGMGDSCTLHALSPSLSNGTPHLLMSHPLPSATQSPLLAPRAPFTEHGRSLVDSPDTWHKANTPHVTSLRSGAKERKKVLIESAKSTPARNTTLVPLVPRKLGGALPSLAPPTAKKGNKPRITPLHASLPI